MRPQKIRALSALALAAVAVGGGVSAGQAHADPELRHYVKTLHCPSADPFPGPPLRIQVDVYNHVAFPSDGLPAPAIELIASDFPRPSILPNLTTYTTETTVRWRNTTTGKRGVVRVPTRSNRVTWQAVLHPGRGNVSFTITQKIGAMAFVPMVNPQYSTCRGSARSV
ncbi:hypothetical protein [Gordonia sp. (in: high G+C Gram-positive bacteria)]|uniref:hypothetical protein n=1 Tax=unclassified Gordonia (in: high G+C Gram-positive bacteria) TaxID=2657482 RepID=UPI00262F6AB6|nr:hypothetical protein [Gordonia sp. (in: high G+C Gram-positive bacteria)]